MVFPRWWAGGLRLVAVRIFRLLVVLARVCRGKLHPTKRFCLFTGFVKKHAIFVWTSFVAQVRRAILCRAVCSSVFHPSAISFPSPKTPTAPTHLNVRSPFWLPSTAAIHFSASFLVENVTYTPNPCVS
jgi:hypothetical protein